jgi:hypothetical protein
VFVFACVLLALLSLLFDALPLIALWVTGDAASWPLSPKNFSLYADVDPLLVAEPPFLVLSIAIHGFIWTPLYIYLARGFWRGDNRIRTPGLIYGSSLTTAMAMIFAEALASRVPHWASPDPALFVALNIAYVLFPIVLMLRLRRPFPFGLPPVLAELPATARQVLDGR